MSDGGGRGKRKVSVSGFLPAQERRWYVGRGVGCGGLAGCGLPPRSHFESLSTSGPTTPGITLTLALSPQGRGDRTPGPTTLEGSVVCTTGVVGIRGR